MRTLSILFTSVLVSSCASTGGSPAADAAREAMNASLLRIANQATLVGEAVIQAKLAELAAKAVKVNPTK